MNKDKLKEIREEQRQFLLTNSMYRTLGDFDMIADYILSIQLRTAQEVIKEIEAVINVADNARLEPHLVLAKAEECMRNILKDIAS